MGKIDNEINIFQDYVNQISIFETEDKFKINLEEISRIRKHFSEKYLKYAKAINEPIYDDFFDPAILTDYHKKSVQEFINNFESIQNNLTLIQACRKLNEVEFVKCRSCDKTTVELEEAVCLDCFGNALRSSVK